jgi:hypothetical protein
MQVELPTSPEGLVVLRNTATGESVEVEPARGGAVRQVALRDSASPHPALHSLLQYGPGTSLSHLSLHRSPHVYQACSPSSVSHTHTTQRFALQAASWYPLPLLLTTRSRPLVSL